MKVLIAAVNGLLMVNQTLVETLPPSLISAAYQALNVSKIAKSLELAPAQVESDDHILCDFLAMVAPRYKFAGSSTVIRFDSIANMMEEYCLSISMP